MWKLAFIDLEFHKKTKSSDFFKDILKEKYDVDVFYEEFPKWDYDVYLYWQAKPSYFDLIKLKNKTIIFCPMYDDTPLIKFFWKRFVNLDMKIICFSRKLYDFFKSMGFDCLYTQYYLPPLNYNVDYSKKKCFFWYRWNITWENVKTIFWNHEVEITIKNKPDPGYKPLKLSKEDIRKYKVTFQNEFFNTKEEYFKHLAKHSIFIAPRVKEWIWMSFLESMSIWQCVIAYDESTMNEYIKNGENGILTNFKEEINISFFQKIWRNCKRAYKNNYNWQEFSDKILQYLCQYSNLYVNWVDRLSSYIIEVWLVCYRYILKAIMHIKK